MAESMRMLNHLGDHFADTDQSRLAALYFQKARQARQRGELGWQAALLHEPLSRAGVTGQRRGN